MTRTARNAWVAALAAVVSLTACNKNTSPPSSDGKTTLPISSAPASQVDGIPQLATTPDYVHIDYRVWGRGEPAVMLIHGWACD